MLRPRPAGGFRRCLDLHVRVHVLRRLRGEGAEGRVPELRRGIYAAGPAAGCDAQETTRLDREGGQAGGGRVAIGNARTSRGGRLETQRGAGKSSSRRCLVVWREGIMPS